MEIREAAKADFEQIWPIFHEIVSTGETYGYARDTTRKQAFNIWLESARMTFVIEVEGQILGTYYIKTNQLGPGSHVCNCGYMVATNATGKGLATAMCEHSQKKAIELGYQAMQYNFVSSANIVAVRLWQKLGFKTVGQIPKAFNHPVKGLIDALVMYKWLV